MEDHWNSCTTKTTTTRRMLLVVVVATFLRIVDRVSGQDGESRDYCEADAFAAHCPKNHIIFMTSALYGRMKVGSCVKKDLGHIGCYSDVMRQADNRCSGKRSCQVRIPDSEFDLTRPCHEELKTYLEASYRCIQVEVPKEGSCQNGVDHPFIVHIGSGMGHISSNLYASSKCSSEAWPIRIQAFPGQRINITIFDFRHSSFASIGSDVSRFQSQEQQQQWLQGRIRRSDVSSTIATTLSTTATTTTSRQSFQMPGMTTVPYHALVWPRNQLRIKRNADSQKHSIKSSSSSSGHGESDCSFHVVTQDRHAARRLRVCPSQLTQRSVYVSSNHSVEVFFKKEQQQQQNSGQENNVDDVDRFLVRYEVLGCEDLELSDEMWRNKAGDAIEVGCKDSEHKWSLRCVSNKWDGLLGNCSKAALFGISAISDADLNSLPHGMAIAVVLCVALLMGLTVLIIGALGLLLRRFHKKTTRHPSTVYGVHSKQGSGSATPSQRMLPGSSNNVMLNSQEFFDYADQRKQQQHHHQHQQQQQQQQPLQRCVGCNAALADYYATLSHRRCIIPPCDDPYPVATNTDSGTVLSNALLQGASDDNGLIDGILSVPGKPYHGFDPSDQADDYSKYPGQGKPQYAREGDYQCTMTGGICASKASFEGPGLSTSAIWKQQKKPNYCPVLDDKTFSRLENLHGCT